MNLANIIVQGGLAFREGQNYDEEQKGRAYTNRVREHGVKRMDEEEARMPAAREIDALKSQIIKNELAYQQQTQGRDQSQRDIEAGIRGSNLEHQQRTLPQRQALDTGALSLAGEQQRLATTQTQQANQLQPGQGTLARGAQAGELAALRERQMANIWSLARLGDTEGAIDMMNKSELVAPGRKFSGVEAGMTPVLGNDGKPLMQNGQPVTERVIRFKAADDKGDMFVPARALDALVARHGAKVEKVGNNLVRIGPEGTAQPIYEPDQFGVNTETGGLFSRRTGQPPVGAAQAAGGMPGATPPPVPGALPPGSPPLTRKGETHATQMQKFVDDRVNDAISKVIMPRYNGQIDAMGQISLPPANRDIALRAITLTRQYVTQGQDPQAAADKAIKQAEIEKTLSDAASGKGGSSTGYTGPTPWR